MSVGTPRTRSCTTRSTHHRSMLRLPAALGRSEVGPRLEFRKHDSSQSLPLNLLRCRLAQRLRAGIWFRDLSKATGHESSVYENLDLASLPGLETSALWLARDLPT